jgi:cell wall-associated NlpC family hydrolase
MKKGLIKYLLYTVLIFVLTSGLTSCRGLLEHIREAQQQGREQNESSYRVVFQDDDVSPKPIDKPRRKKEDANITVGSDYAVYQTKWNIPLEGTEDLLLLAEVDSWLGTPYKYGGTTHQGTDCSGMVMSIYKKLYHIDTERSAYDLWKTATLVKKNQLKSGDLVFFKINRKQISHVGIYISNGYFVHASSSRGVIIDHLDTAYYADRFASGGRINR